MLLVIPNPQIEKAELRWTGVTTLFEGVRVLALGVDLILVGT